MTQDSVCSRSRTEGFCFPQKARVRLLLIFQLLLVSISTVQSFRALDCQGDEIIAMARHLYLRGCPNFCMRLSLVPAISGRKQSEPPFLTETEGDYLAKHSLSGA